MNGLCRFPRRHPCVRRFSPKRPNAGRGIRIPAAAAVGNAYYIHHLTAQKHPCHQAVCSSCACARANPSGMQAMFSSLFPRRAGLRAFPWMSWRPAALATVAGYVHAAARLCRLRRTGPAALCQAENAALQQALLAARRGGKGGKLRNAVRLSPAGRLPAGLWINRVIEEEYGGYFNLAPYAGFEGVMQQYMFYYGRLCAKGNSNGRCAASARRMSARFHFATHHKASASFHAKTEMPPGRPEGRHGAYFIYEASRRDKPALVVFRHRRFSFAARFSLRRVGPGRHLYSWKHRKPVS